MVALREGIAIGPYVVESLLPEGRGGFSQVVVARRKVGNRFLERVALKIAKVDAATREEDSATEMARFAESSLQNEVEMLRELKHPGIVRLYPIPTDGQRLALRVRAAEIDGRPWYFAMEYLAGGSVEALLREQGKLSLALAAEVTGQVCMALEYVHNRGLAHMDIKTSNILLRQTLAPDALPQVVLVDFGATQKAERQAEADQGVLVYMPPERVQVIQGTAASESLTDKAAVDVYSTGIALYRMLTGRVPFAGRDEHVKTAILNDPPTLPSRYNRDLLAYPEIDRLISEMLDKDRRNRPRSAEVVSRLERLFPAPRFAPGLTAGLVGKPHLGYEVWRGVALALLGATVVEFAAMSYLAWPRLFPGAALAPDAAANTASPAPVVATAAQPTRVSTFTPLPAATATRSQATATLVPTHTPAPTRTPLPTDTPGASPTPGAT